MHRNLNFLPDDFSPVANGTQSNQARGSEMFPNDGAVDLALHLSQQQFTGRAGNPAAQIESFQGWSYVAINAMCKVAASAKPTIFDDRIEPEKSSIDDDETLERADRDFRWWKMLKSPNPWQSGGQLRWEIVQQLGVHGMSIVWNVKNGFGKTMWRLSIPMALITPLSPGSRSNMPYGGIRVHSLQWINQYMDTPLNQMERYDYIASKEISLQDITLTAFPHPFLRGDGYSPQTAGRRWIDLVQAAEDAQKEQYRRGPMRKFLMKMPEEACQTTHSADTWQRKMDDRMLDTDTGVIGVSHDFNGQEVTIDPDQMVYIDTINTLGPALMALHGTPKTVVGLSEGQTYGSNAAAMQAFVTNSVQPVLDLIAEEETSTMKREEGHAFEIKYDCPTVRDPDVEAREIDQDIQAKAITKKEYRRKRGYKPFGDERDDQIVGEGPGGPASPGTQNAGMGMGGKQGDSGIGGANPSGSGSGAAEIPSGVSNPQHEGDQGSPGLEPPEGSARNPNFGVEMKSADQQDADKFDLPEMATLMPQLPSFINPDDSQKKSLGYGQSGSFDRPVIAFDIDGALVDDESGCPCCFDGDHDHHDHSEVKPREDMVDLVRLLSESGCVIVLCTHAGEDQMKSVRGWLGKNNIPWDGINENPYYGVEGGSKQMFDVMIDDRVASARNSDGILYQTILDNVSPGHGERIKETVEEQVRLSRYGKIVVPLGGRFAEKLREIQTSIDTNDLDGEGVVRDLELKILMGMVDANRSDVARIMGIMNVVPFKLDGTISVKDSMDHGISRIVANIRSEDIEAMHEVAKRSFPHMEREDVYSPHITLAYVRSDQADKYTELQSPNAGAKVDKLVYKQDGEDNLIVPLKRN